MREDDRERVAYHEAGHAVVHSVLRVPFEYVTIRPRHSGSAGLVWCRDNIYEIAAGDDSDILTFLAGTIAEAKWESEHCSVSGRGLDALEREIFFRETSAGDRSALPLPADGDLRRHWDAAHHLVGLRWHSIAAVARALMKAGTLRQRDVRQLTKERDDRGSLVRFGLMTRVETRKHRVAQLQDAYRRRLAQSSTPLDIRRRPTP